MKLQFMLDNKKLFDVCETTEKFIRSWNPATSRHEPDAELFNKMFDTNSTLLLTEVTEQWLDHLIETQGVCDTMLAHKYNAEEEMAGLLREAEEEMAAMGPYNTYGY